MIVCARGNIRQPLIIATYPRGVARCGAARRYTRMKYFHFHDWTDDDAKSAAADATSAVATDANP